MPLTNGNSRDTISKNVKKLVHEFEVDGTIGTSRPDSKQEAVKQAVAISLKNAGVSRRARKSSTH